jgi:hypothetical protein
MPQPPIGAHEPAELELDQEPDPLLLDAKVDILRRIWALPHVGQTTSLTAIAARTNSSNDLWHSVH